MVGDVLSSYRILSRAGQGRTGTVYLAERIGDRLRVALKILHPEIAADSARRQRLLGIARGLSRIDHGSIARVIEVLDERDAAAIVTEWVEGESLSDRRLRGPIPEAQAARIGAAVCEAIAEAHQRGFVDLEIEASHIMLDESGAVKLIGLEPEVHTPGRPAGGRADVAAIGRLLGSQTSGAGSQDTLHEMARAFERLTRAAAPRERRWIVPGAMALITVVALLAIFARAASVRESNLLSIAVLPFEADSRDPGTGFLGIGLADSLIGRLSRAGVMTVRPMSAVIQAMTDRPDPLEAAQRLQASLVLTGRCTDRDDGVRIDVELLDVAKGSVVWTQAFDSAADDPRPVEDSISDALIHRLVPVVAASPGRGDRRGPPAPIARYLYLVARGRLADNESRPLAEAVSLLEQAIAADPDLASAHAALAQASANMFLGGLSSDRAWLERGIAAGRRAVLLDEDDSDAHFSLGYALLYSGDPVAAAREILRALEIDPTAPPALRVASALLSQSGALRPARMLRNRALHVNPADAPGWVDVYLATGEGRVSEAIVLLEREVELRLAEGRSAEIAVQTLGYLAFESGDAAAGLRWAAMLEDLSANYVYADLVRLLALARMGNAEAVERILGKNRQAYWFDWEYSLWIGRALVLIGDTEGSITWLSRSAALGGYDLHTFQKEELLLALKDDPRYREALATVRARAKEILKLAALSGYS